MKDLIYDYTQAQKDAETIKQFLIEQMPRFKDEEDMDKYIHCEFPYYLSDGKGLWGEIWAEIAKQHGVKYISQVENGQWILEYLDHIADHELVTAMNSGLNTRKRKTADRELFYQKYKIA